MNVSASATVTSARQPFARSTCTNSMAPSVRPGAGARSAHPAGAARQCGRRRVSRRRHHHHDDIGLGQRLAHVRRDHGQPGENRAAPFVAFQIDPFLSLIDSTLAAVRLYRVTSSPSRPCGGHGLAAVAGPMTYSVFRFPFYLLITDFPRWTIRSISLKARRSLGPPPRRARERLSGDDLASSKGVVAQVGRV